MRRTCGLGLGLIALAITGTVEGQQMTKSAFTGLNKPVALTTKTVSPSSALTAPNTTRALQTPIRPKSPSLLTFPKLQLAAWPPRFSFSSILPRSNNPFQPKAAKGHNPFETGKVVPIKTVNTR